MRSLEILALGALLLQPGDATRPAAPSVYVLSALDRALQRDPPPAHPHASIELFAARGETEAAQIVLYGGAPGLESVQITAAPSMPADVRLYLERYIAITAPSNSGVGGARPGVYPDALVPFRNPFTSAPLIQTINVPALENQPVYVEAAVPASAAPGVYKGYVSVSAAGRAFASVPLTLTVWNFALPARTSLFTAFQDYDSTYDQAARYYGYAPNSPQHASMARAMDALLMEHRVVNATPMNSGFRVAPDGHVSANRNLQTLLTRPGQTDYALSFGPNYPFSDPLGAHRPQAITYLRDSFQWFARRGLAGKVFIRTNDEPHTDAEFEQTRAFADLIHEANPKWRVAITGATDSPGFAKYLQGRLDIFVACAPYFDPAQLPGNHFWSYTAVVQNANHPSPHWQIDFPLLNFRIMPWINFRYGMDGLLYWTSTHWNPSPWSDPCSLKVANTCFNGDGLLLYPGKNVGYSLPEKVYGNSVWGPIAALRLKAIRDGIQDYELLKLAARRDPAAAMDAAIEIGCGGDRSPGDANHNCFHHWNTDPAALIAMRARLAAVILKQ